MKYPFITLSCILLALNGCYQAKETNILSYGAVADGMTNNAVSIQQNIDEVASSGGGRVIVPPGNFVTGTIFLKTGVELHLEAGACLLGSVNRSDYVQAKRPALIMATNVKNISITGKGVIDGRGQELMLDIFQKIRSGELVQNDTLWLVKRPSNGRVKLIEFESCNGIVVADVTLKNATNWVQNYTECENILITRINVQSTAYWNNDGLDITDCRNVRITKCFINASDDAICLKSENSTSWCQNILIDSCTVRSSANGFKLGTASHGGFKDITVRNLEVFDTYRSAIAIEMVDGGTLENIDVSHVTARNTGNAIFIRRGRRNTDGDVGVLRNVHISNVKAEIPLYKPDQGYPIEGPPDHLKPGEDKMPVRPSHFHIFGHPFLPYNLVPSSITGLPGNPVQDVFLENIEITYAGRADKSIACIPLNRITSVPENEANYPEFSMFGELPSWAFYVRHAEGLKMKHVTFTFKQHDFRPAMVFDDVTNFELLGVTIPSTIETPVIVLNNTSGESISQLRLPFDDDKSILRTNYKN